MRQRDNHLAHEIQTLFFLQPLFKPLLIKFILTTKRSDIQVARLRWLLCYATFDRGLAQAEKVGVRGVGSIKFIRVPGEHSAFIQKKKQEKQKK
jgi:hypothetical protein